MLYKSHTILYVIFCLVWNGTAQCHKIVVKISRLSIGLPYNCYYFFLSSKVEIVWSQETSRKYCSLLAYALNMYMCNLDGRYYWKYYVFKRYILTSHTYEENLRLKKNEWESFALPIMDKLATICFFFRLDIPFTQIKHVKVKFAIKMVFFTFL